MSYPGGSSNRRIWKYDAFISFRGEDTRNSIVSHIYSAFHRNGIYTFKDDLMIEIGEPIRSVLFTVIEETQICFVIFSQNYPTSSWCLDELEKISEKIDQSGCFVVPIFYDVDPSDVRELSGKYKELFVTHEMNFNDDKDKVVRWKKALTRVASFPGIDLRAKSEADVVDEIVADAASKLGHRSSRLDADILFPPPEEYVSSLADYLVGTQSHVEAPPDEYVEIAVRLRDIYRDIFVDVACFYNGADEKYATEVLEHCGFNPKIGIRALCDSSLLKIVNGRLWMNDILQQQGWKIAKGEFPNEPAKWSRLWSFQDIQTVNTGTGKVEAIVLSPDDLQETPLNAEALSQMRHLRLIIFPNDVKISGNLIHLSNKLRFLSWRKFPFRSWPSSFEPHKLVELIMPDSNLIELWKGEKRLPNLRSIVLSGSKSLTKTPNVKGVENLERLDLEGCTGLLQVDPSIADLKRIKFLNLRNCDRLVSIPDTLFKSTSLKLNIAGCSGLAE